MNIWHWILFYIYSGVALNGLCAGATNDLIPGFYEPDDDVTDDGRLAAERRTRAMDRVVRQSMVIGNLMASATTMDLIGGYQQGVINAYEQQKKQNDAALKVVPTANKAGA